jgi:hypothetical protein
MCTDFSNIWLYIEETTLHKEAATMCTDMSDTWLYIGETTLHEGAFHKPASKICESPPIRLPVMT